MLKRFLGNTDISVSVIGLGTVKFGRNSGVRYPASFDLPSDKALAALLDQAASLGINLIDTAPAYGTSEERLGQLLRGQRHQWVITTKVGEAFIAGKSTFDFSKSAMLASVECSLKRLHTDYLDVLLVHSNGDDERIIQEHDVFMTLNDLKKAGKIRAFGMSIKTVNGGLLTIDYADVAMVTFNPTQQQEQEVIIYAEQKQKGIFIKKALASGHLHQIDTNDPVFSTMHFIFREKGVTSVIVGTINPEHLQQNVASALLCAKECAA